MRVAYLQRDELNENEFIEVKFHMFYHVSTPANDASLGAYNLQYPAALIEDQITGKLHTITEFSFLRFKLPRDRYVDIVEAPIEQD